MKIKNNSGQYWNGECWGAMQAAEDYHAVDDLPVKVDGLQMEIHSLLENGAIDIRYYAADEDEATAGVL